MNKLIFFALLMFFMFSCKTQNNMIDKSVVKEVNIEKYLGKWYEIARFDHRFERGLVGTTVKLKFRTPKFLLN